MIGGVFKSFVTQHNSQNHLRFHQLKENGNFLKLNDHDVTCEFIHSLFYALKKKNWGATDDDLTPGIYKKRTS